MVLVFVVSGVVQGRAGDLLLQFPFQLFVVLLCAPDVLVLGGVEHLPGYLGPAGKKHPAGGKAGQQQKQQYRQHPQSYKQVGVAFYQGGTPLCSAGC